MIFSADMMNIHTVKLKENKRQYNNYENRENEL